MKERMIPRAHARDIADLCVDVADKAHEWKARALAAEAVVRGALPLVRLLLEGDLNGGCKVVNGVPDRSTADPAFRDTIAACDAVITAAEALSAPDRLQGEDVGV